MTDIPAAFPAASLPAGRPDDASGAGSDQPPVVVLLVCHNGEQYLPRTLAAIEALHPAPAAVVAVDTGSTDTTPGLLAAAASGAAPVVHRVLDLPASTGYAQALHAAMDEAPGSEWLWLLHDDSAPEPDCLGMLLSAAADQPSVAVWGPKVLGWDEPRRLLEIGVSISRSGRRYTGLERGEQDQGQYDGQRDVLAVGSAGMLCRRDLWSDLGGFERALHFFREDVDFGWRVNLAGHRVAVATDAVVHHAEAMARGRRLVNVATGHRPAAAFDPHVHDRASALFTLLANARSSTWVLRWLWLMLQTLVRSLGFVVGKAPREAAAEMAALATVLLRPGQIVRVRRSRRRWRTVSQRSLRAYFPPTGQQLRHTLETLAGPLTIEPDVAGSGPGGPVESGPGDDDLDSFVSASSGRLRRLIRRPGVILFAGLLLVQLVAWRGLYRGGVLQGGALLPMPRGASDVWQAYLAAWHPVTLGSDTMAHPSSAVLGVLATALLGHASWVVPVVLVLAPAVSGVLAYLVTGPFGLSLRLRLGVAIVYALNPVTIAATAQGRWTTAVVQMLLPLTAVAVARATGLGGAAPSLRATAVGVVLLAMMASVAPPTLLLVVVLGIALAVRLAGRARLMAAALVVGPVLVLLPWWSVVIQDPAVLLLEPGVRLVADSEAPWQAAFFDPGGWWSLPWWLGVGLTVAVLGSVLQALARPAVRGALVVYGAAMLWALVLEAVRVTPDTSAVAVDPWSGSVLLLALAAALVSSAVAVRGARRRLAKIPFSWRQPGVAVVAALVVGSVAIWGLAWLGHGASGPLDRGAASPLPAFVRAQSALPEQIRTLVLQPDQGRLAYTILRSRGAQWGDIETAPAAADMVSMDDVVSDLASGRGAAPVDELADRAVQYILALAPVDDELETALDSAPGLLRVANPGDSSLWRVQEDTGRVRLDSGVSSPEALASEVEGDPAEAHVQVEPGESDRVLALAELADEGWRAAASTDGASEQLPRAPDASWSQRFVVGAGAAQVTMSVQDRVRQVALWVQLLLVVVLVVVALPGRARPDEEAV
jgi:GT2 family glycosyltransferase